MDYLWLKIFALIPFLLLAWFLGFITKFLRFGKPLGYFLSGIIGVQLFNLLFDVDFHQFFIEDIEHFKIPLTSFVFAYLSLHCFRATEYFKFKKLKKNIKTIFPLVILSVIVIEVLGIFILNFVYNSPSYTLFLGIILFSPYLLNNKNFLKKSFLKNIYYQYFLLYSLVSCLIFVFYNDLKQSANLFSSIYLGTVIFLGVFLFLNFLNSNNKSISTFKFKDIFITKDETAHKYYFYLIFLTFFCFTYFALTHFYYWQIGVGVSVLISGCILANLSVKRIYSSMKLLNRFYLGDIILFLYLGFNCRLGEGFEGSALSFISLFITKVVISCLVFFYFKLKYKEEIPLYALFALMPIYSLLLFVLPNNINLNSLIFFEICSISLFYFFLKNSKYQYYKKSKEQEQELTLEELIGNRILLDMEVKNRKDAIKMLLSELVRDGYFDNIKELIPKVMNRETISSTALGQRIAVPHFRVKELRVPLVVCGLLRKGENLDWDAPDGLAVKYIFLIVTPEENVDIHLKALKKVSYILDDEEKIIDMFEAKRQEEITSFYQKYEVI